MRRKFWQLIFILSVALLPFGALLIWVISYNNDDTYAEILRDHWREHKKDFQTI